MNARDRIPFRVRPMLATRSDARDFLDTASSIGLRPRATPFSLDQANEALSAIENDSIDGAAVILPGD